MPARHEAASLALCPNPLAWIFLGGLPSVPSLARQQPAARGNPGA